jgi:hypothetical protein
MNQLQVVYEKVCTPSIQTSLSLTVLGHPVAPNSHPQSNWSQHCEQHRVSWSNGRRHLLTGCVLPSLTLLLIPNLNRRISSPSSVTHTTLSMRNSPLCWIRWQLKANRQMLLRMSARLSWKSWHQDHGNKRMRSWQRWKIFVFASWPPRMRLRITKTFLQGLFLALSILLGSFLLSLWLTREVFRVMKQVAHIQTDIQFKLRKGMELMKRWRQGDNGYFQHLERIQQLPEVCTLCWTLRLHSHTLSDGPMVSRIASFSEKCLEERNIRRTSRN